MVLGRGQHASIAAVSFALLLGANPRADQPLYKSIDAPNAALTTAQGINPRGDVVGWFVDKTDKHTHGYLLRDDVFTRIDYPNAVYTDARGINARGEIVGAYRMLGEPAVNFHGYMLTTDGTFVPLDFPGHTNTIPQHITSTGQVFGCRHDNDLMVTMRGVRINSRDTTDVAEIDAFASMNNGGTPDAGAVVGLYQDMDTNIGRAYLLVGDAFLPFDVPGSNFTAGWDMNPEGEVVGVYRDAAANRFHGFLWSGLRFRSIDYPSAAATRAFGLNSRGDIVGAYIDAANATHGFILARDDDQ